MVAAVLGIGLAFQSRMGRTALDASANPPSSLSNASPPTPPSAQSAVSPASEPGGSTSVRSAFDPRDTMILAEFDDRTGSEGLAVALDRAMLAAAESSAIPIASAQRIHSLLQRMRLPAATRVTDAVARAVAVRDGRIRYVAHGWVQRTGDRFTVLVNIVESSSGAALVTRRDNHRDPAALVNLTARLTSSAIDGLRSKMGTALATRTLEPVTAASQEAVQARHSGDRCGRRPEQHCDTRTRDTSARPGARTSSGRGPSCAGTPTPSGAERRVSGGGRARCLQSRRATTLGAPLDSRRPRVSVGSRSSCRRRVTRR